MISSVLVVLVIRAFGMAFWLLTTLLLARTLPVEDFSLSLLAINVILLCGALSTLGADVSLLRHASLAWRDGRKSAFLAELRHGRLIAYAGSAVAIVASCLALFFNAASGAALGVTGILVVAVGIVLTAQLAVNRTALRSAERVGEAILAESFLRSFITFGIAGVLALLGNLSLSLFLIAYAASLLVGWLSQRHYLTRLDLPGGRGETIPSRVKFALSIWPGEAALIVFHRIPGVLIGFTVDLKTAAVFLAAERVAQAGMFLVDAVRTVIGPDIAAARGDQRQPAISAGSAIMFLAAILGSALTLLLGAYFVHLLGDAYESAFPIIAILVAGQFSYAILGPTAIILNMYGQEKLRSVVTLVSTVALCGCLFLSSDVYQIAWSYAAMLWIMNLALALGIWTRLGYVSGIAGVSAKSLLDALREVKELVAKLKPRNVGTN